MGKITVKHYLNTRVAPKKDERGNDTYPIFFMIIFNRMTIRKETIILRLFNRVTEEDFNNKTYSKIIKAGLNYELNLIHKIVEKFEKDTENNTVSKKFLNFDYSYSYSSKNQNLNLLNSYINFYSSAFIPVIFRYVDDIISKELEKKLDDIFNFKDYEDNKFYIIEILKDSPLLDGFPKNKFLFNNISERGKRTIFLDFCYSRFAEKREAKTGYYDTTLFEWFLDFDKIKKEYVNFVLRDKEIIRESQIAGINLEQEVKKYQLEELKNIISDPNFIEKYKIE